MDGELSGFGLEGPHTEVYMVGKVEAKFQLEARGAAGALFPIGEKVMRILVLLLDLLASVSLWEAEILAGFDTDLWAVAEAGIAELGMVMSTGFAPGGTVAPGLAEAKWGGSTVDDGMTEVVVVREEYTVDSDS